MLCGDIMLHTNEYLMPAVIKSERIDIIFLIKLFNDIRNANYDVFYLNYKDTYFFASELYSLYHHYIEDLKSKGIKVIGINVVEDVDYVNHLSDRYSIKDSFPTHNSVILPHDFSEELVNKDYDSFDNYARKELLPKVNNNRNITNIVVPYLSELFVNSRTHGQTNTILCAGQIYTIRNRIKFVIVDFGVTIPYNIENYEINGKTHYFHENDGDAIRWSTKEGTSTKESLGGLGLNSIKDFIDRNNGRLLIISRFGSYERRNSRDKVVNSSIKFDGTLVVVELDLNALEKIEKPVMKKEIFSI